MNNTINMQSGERLSFFKLFSQKEYRVFIPIIQRDYAQGRKTTKEVRDIFLNALYNYLNENIPNRDLDFVYGSLNDVNGITDFIPLDGQQRLTTLFLLHWYLCQISENDDKKKEFKNALLKDDKSMFTYETRSSSSEFCTSLLSNDIDFNNLLEPDIDANGESLNNSLTKSIKNCPWFYLSWQYDPTILSMLTMLDAIHKKFSLKKDFFERLLDTENPIITFLFLNLEDFKLTDDLYIKMNSRGKPLTSFENFKAKFEQYLEKVNADRRFTLIFKNSKKDVSLKEYFSYNIDTKWANLFWNYRTLQNRSKSENDETHDDEIMNFVRVIFANQYALSVDVSQKEKDYALEYLLGTNVARKDKEYSDVISFNMYEELNALTNESVLNLFDAFDCFVNGNEKIMLHLCDDYKYYFNEHDAFENALKYNFDNNHQRLCFHAYVRYLIQNKNDLTSIKQWMRVIHNLTHPDNTVIDNASEVAAAIKSIEELLPFSNNILEHLKSKPNISFFSNWQVLEEQIKAHLITINDSWKIKVEEVEKHGYFNGQIGFIIEFADILKYYNDNANCLWNNEEDIEYFRKFKDYAEKASKVFEESYENRINDKNYIFERAVFTKGDYLTSASQYRKNLLSTNLVKNNIKRDHSWKRLLRVADDNEWLNRRMLVKQVFDDIRFDKNNIETSLIDICKDKTDTWRDYFITCPSLLRFCIQGFIRFENEQYILLYGESQSNFYHAEMYTYFLWKKVIEQNIDTYKPFKRIYYSEVKSIEDDACIVFDDFCYNRIHYQIRVYYCNTDELPNPYEIAFRKSKGENLPENYESEILEFLNNLNFKWNTKYGGYFYTSNKIYQVQEKLKKLTENLNELD